MRRSMRRRAMSRSLFVLAFCVLLVQGACTQSGSQGSEDRLPIVIETLVGQLGAPEDDVRRDAVGKLIQIGPDVLSLVKKARDETDDPEVRYRCDEVTKGIARNFPPIPSLFEISDWGRGFPEERREPIVYEAVRRLRITRHEDTVVDALEALAHTYNWSVKTDIVPVVEPFALEGSVRVRCAAIMALYRAVNQKGEYDRCFFAVSRALSSGEPELVRTAILRMQRFNDPDHARKMFHVLLTFLDDPDSELVRKAGELSRAYVPEIPDNYRRWPHGREYQQALRKLYRRCLDDKSLALEQKTLTWADPHDPKWEEIAREAVFSEDYAIYRFAIALLIRIWHADPRDPGHGRERTDDLAIECLNSPDRARRAFAVRYIMDFWAGGPYTSMNLHADGMSFRGAVRAEPVERTGRRFVKRLYYSGNVITLSPQVASELRSAGGPDWLVDELKTLEKPVKQREGASRLFDMLKSPDRDIRNGVEWLLARLARSDDEIPLRAARMVGDPDIRVRAVAFEVFYRMGSAGRPAVGPLVKLLKHEDYGIRTSAALALGRIGPGATDAVDALAEALKDRDRRRHLMNAAAGALARIGEPGLRPLLDALKDEDKRLQRRAAHMILECSPVAAKWSDELIVWLKQAEPQERAFAVGYMRLVPLPAPKKVAPLLIEGLRAESASQRELAANALWRIGPTVKAVPALIHALEDEHYQVRKLAAMTLSKAGPAAKPAVPELARMLQDKEFDVTWAAALALKALGPIAAEAVEPVAEMMLWEDQRQDTARQILPRIGAPAVPSLIGLLQNDRFAVRHAGAGALVRIGTPSVDGLIAALKNSNAAGRKTAAEVLGEILPIRKDVAGALTQAMKDKDADVRQSASDALRRIRARQGG